MIGLPSISIPWAEATATLVGFSVRELHLVRAEAVHRYAIAAILDGRHLPRRALAWAAAHGAIFGAGATLVRLRSPAEIAASTDPAPTNDCHIVDAEHAQDAVARCRCRCRR